MTRLHTVLLGALGVQALLTVATWWPRDNGTVEATPLVDLEAEAITKVVVQRPGEDAEPLELLKEGDSWSIVSSAGYPAEADKVGDLFDRECTLTMTGNPMSGTYSPNEMGALALKMRSGFTRVAIRFSDHEVTFPDDNTAEVLMVTRVKGETLAAGKVDELLETRSRLNEVEGEWRFAEFTVIESLQK